MTGWTATSVRIQPDLWGAGRITEEWADPEGFQTRLAAIDHAAGPPAPDLPRGAQLAEGSLATARAWLAGRSAHPLAESDLAGVDRDGFPADAAAPRYRDPDDVDTAVVDRLDAAAAGPGSVVGTADAGGPHRRPRPDRHRP